MPLHHLPLHDIHVLPILRTNRPATPGTIRRPAAPPVRRLLATVLFLAAALLPAQALLAAGGTAATAASGTAAVPTVQAVQPLQPEPSIPAGQPIQPGAIALAAGQLHTLLVHADGRLFAFGDNAHGQLGTGNDAPQAGMVEIEIGRQARSAAAGAFHSLVLTADGMVHAFGRNAFGQLGIGTVDNSAFPLAIEGLPPAAAVAAGAYHSLVLGRDGSVWAFGDHTHGQCGPAAGENVQNESGQLVARRVIRPQRILTGGARAIAAGSAHSLILLERGVVLAFGANSHGQLGDGTRTGRSEMLPVPGIAGATLVAAGSDHSLVVAEASEPEQETARLALLAFGDNSLGQLGTGSRFAPGDQAHSPVRVDWETAAGDGFEIHSLAAGYGNSLLIIERPPASETGAPVQPVATSPGASSGGPAGADPRTARVLIWGSNAHGQLGTGDSASRDRPTRLKAVDQGHGGDSWLPFEAMAIGGGHVLLASRRGLFGAAGRNGSGQLGTAPDPATGVSEPLFTGVALPPLDLEPASPSGQPETTLDQLREPAFGLALRSGQNLDKVLPLQVPWDTTYAFGVGSVPEPADPRRPILWSAAALAALAALLAAGRFLVRRQRRRPLEAVPANPSGRSPDNPSDAVRDNPSDADREEAGTTGP